MRILNRYITGSFLATFFATVTVFTFVLSIGGLFKLTELLTRGVSWRPLVGIFLSAMPGALSFAIPISALTATLLVFGRLSADNEIIAMKSCGISLWQISRWVLPFAVVLVLLCLYVNNELAPASHYARRSAVSSLKNQSPLELLEEGRFIQEFKGLTVYIGRKRDKNLEDLKIYDLRREGQKREIRAKSGIIIATTNKSDILIELTDVTIDPFSFDRPGAGNCSKWLFRIEDVMRVHTYRKRIKDKTFGELIRGIYSRENDVIMNAEDVTRNRMSMSVELHKRLTLSFCCFSFVLLGVPLGIRSHRKESSIGVAISLLLVFVFYLFIIVAESMSKHPAWHPDMIAWIPVVISLVLGFFLIKRMD